MSRLKHRVVLVTAGASGLGQASCELLAREGAQVIVSDVNKSGLEQVVQGIITAGGDAIGVKLDISSEYDWEKTMDVTLKKYGRLDVLVNNAGICLEGDLKDTLLDDWRKVFNINMEGTFLGMRSAINAMNKNLNMSSIINISSIAGLTGDHPASYSASKAGVRMLSKSAAIEFAKKGYRIRVNTIFPGPINTPMSAQLTKKEEWERVMKLVPLGRMAEPLEIAQAVLFLASDESSYMTGSDLVIDGGVTAGNGGILIDLD